MSISPPAWGWPGAVEEEFHPPEDFPTRVGMARIEAIAGMWAH